MHARLSGLNEIYTVFNATERLEHYASLFIPALETFIKSFGHFSPAVIGDAARYLCSELRRGETFIISLEAESIVKAFQQELKTKRAQERWTASLGALENNTIGKFDCIHDWITAFLEASGNDDDSGHFISEVTILLLTDSYHPRQVIQTASSLQIDGLLGDHTVINKGAYRLNYIAFMDKLRTFKEQTLPHFLRFQKLKKELTDTFRAKLRLEEFKPRVMTSFVRNQLIDKAYLPLIGDNLAKQVGVVGEAKRTDLMGMLLLISSRLWQNHTYGIYRQPAWCHLYENQRPGNRAWCHFTRSG